jgi:indolepyruvate ferredoxin oxidoreductase alpha subunit
MTAQLLSGNEAVALAATHSGVKLATGYPGTPSTEILETLAGIDKTGIVKRWAPNEKVALEVGIGSAFAGARTMVTMKHVGVNVAADPLFTAAYTGVEGGLVLVCADDPGMHSSQNEQDNRNYAAFAGIPMLEPADSQEAYDFLRRGLEISEEFQTLVLLRMTTRICHSKTLVVPSEPTQADREPHFERDIPRFVMVPAFARKAHARQQERLNKLADYSEDCELNALPKADGAELGIVAAGPAYQYVKEVVGDEVPVFKLGMSWPMPMGKLRRFADSVDRLLVVEELTEFTRDKLRAAGIQAEGKSPEYRLGELNIDRVARIIAGEPDQELELPDDLPPRRPPVLCPGCGHRSVFAILREMKLTVTGDIGCYTLGALPPLSNMDTCVCMGASVGVGLGMGRVLPEEEAARVVAVIGDSTFWHSGLTGVVDAIYNGSTGTLLILDNSTTAMTGGQDHPGTGERLDGLPAPALDPGAVCRAMGVQDVQEVDAWDRDALREALENSLGTQGYSVIVARRPCLLLERRQERQSYEIDAEACKNCGACIRLGCPALVQKEGHVEINRMFCNGCGLCYEVCKFDAIAPAQQ